MRTISNVAAFLVLSFWCLTASAGSLAGSGTIVGDGSGSISAVTVFDNNDEIAGPNPNGIGINLVVNGMGFIDKRLLLGPPTGGVTEYAVTENILNGTNITFTDFHLELGWLMNNMYLASAAGDGLDFDWGVLPIGPSNTPPPSSTALLTVVNNINEDMLDYYSSHAGDVVLPGGSFTLFYSVDLPDPPPNATHLVIRQWATPEPASVVLMALGGLAAARRRRTHQA